jgi:hypothetical protein
MMHNNPLVKQIFTAPSLALEIAALAIKGQDDRMNKDYYFRQIGDKARQLAGDLKAHGRSLGLEVE